MPIDTSALWSYLDACEATSVLTCSTSHGKAELSTNAFSQVVLVVLIKQLHYEKVNKQVNE